jgi:hypothetical protein
MRYGRNLGINGSVLGGGSVPAGSDRSILGIPDGRFPRWVKAVGEVSLVPAVESLAHHTRRHSVIVGASVLTRQSQVLLLG